MKNKLVCLQSIYASLLTMTFTSVYLSLASLYHFLNALDGHNRTSTRYSMLDNFASYTKNKGESYKVLKELGEIKY